MDGIRRYFILIIFLASGCSNNQNEMMMWASKIKVGSKVQTVKQSQPDYLTIDWENPDTLEDGKIRYFITDINGSKDILKMSYYLEFDSLGFRGQFAHK